MYVSSQQLKQRTHAVEERPWSSSRSNDQSAASAKRGAARTTDEGCQDHPADVQWR